MRCESYTLHRAPHTRLTLPWDSLVPLMITRLILSLKKAANPQASIWSLSGTGQLETARFASHTIGGTEGEGGDIVLGHLSSERRSGLSRNHDQS